MTNAKIPVARYMEVRSASSPTYSHDDDTLYFLSTMTGLPQVWTLDGNTPWPRQHTFLTDRVMGVNPSPSEDIVIVSADEGGTENAQLYCTDKSGVHLENLTNDPKHIYAFGGWASDGRSFCFSSNRRNGRAFDVYVYDIHARTFRCVYESEDTNFAAGFTPDGSSVLFVRMHTNLNHDLYLVNVASGEVKHLSAHGEEAQFHPVGFSADGETLYCITDKDSEFSRLARITVENGCLEMLTPDDWDVDTATLSKDKQMVALARNEDGTSGLYIWRLNSDPSEVLSNRVETLPPGVVASVNFARTSHTLALTLSSPLHATEVWSYQVEDSKFTRVTYASISSVPQNAFVAPELIHYPSFDGLEIPAYYYRPKNTEGPFPVVVYVHGGPEGQTQNTFNSVIQYFVQEGFAVLAPNVRGSSGYGRTYIHLDDVRKRMDSVQDLACCVNWLVEHGNADRNAIAVMGGSYGGFMVLAAVTHHPHLWAAGVDIVGIANLRTFIENTSPYRRHLRECEYGTVEADGEFFDQISPIHYVQQITAPMMVIHGQNDPRVPVGEAEQIVAALEARNHPVEYLCFEDEGHGVVKLPNRIKAYGDIAEFLKKHLMK